MKKSAIALLITVMFIIVITVAIGYGLKEVNRGSQMIRSENFMYQSTIVVEDVLKILQSSPDLQKIADSNSSLDLYTFLSSASAIPLNIKNFRVMIKLKSARAKINPSMINKQTINLFKSFLNNHRVNTQYADVLMDAKNGVKADNSYNSMIFDDNPTLFRDYIASKKHLKYINNFYKKEYNTNDIDSIDFDKLFYYSSDTNMSIDVNYATTPVWEFMLSCTQQRAEELNLNAGSYEKVSDLNLNDIELKNFKNFKTSFFEPILLVSIEIKQDKDSSKIEFEYNIKDKEGSNFVYEI